MTVTCVPSAFVTWASYAADAFVPSFSVVAESTVPPTFAIAAALTFARMSPVRAVSGVRVVFAVVPVVVAAAVFGVDPAPRATVAPTSAQAASAAAPADVFMAFLVMGSFLEGAGAISPENHPQLGKRSERAVS